MLHNTAPPVRATWRNLGATLGCVCHLQQQDKLVARFRCVWSRIMFLPCFCAGCSTVIATVCAQHPRHSVKLSKFWMQPQFTEGSSYNKQCENMSGRAIFRGVVHAAASSRQSPRGNMRAEMLRNINHKIMCSRTWEALCTCQDKFVCNLGLMLWARFSV